MTADYRLWAQVEPFVGTKSIDIESAKPHHLNGLTYVCFELAKDILTGSRTVVLGQPALPPELYGGVLGYADTGLRPGGCQSNTYEAQQKGRG